MFPLNGGVVFTNNFKMGSMATFICNRGYKIVGKFQRICTSNRTWTGVSPFCISGKKIFKVLITSSVTINYSFHARYLHNVIFRYVTLR